MVSEKSKGCQSGPDTGTAARPLCRARGAAVPVAGPAIKRGASPSNTPLSTSQTGGEDTVHLGLGVFWGDAWEALRATLREAKEKAQDPESRSPVSVTLGNAVLVVNPNGRKAGGGGPFYAFRFEYAGMQFSIMDRIDPPGDTPNVRVEMGSLVLMEWGFERVYQVVLELLRRMGGTVQWNKLTRVDLCADLPGLSPAVFQECFRNDCVVSRARKRDEHWEGKQFTGLGIGMGGEISCRIYDKELESRHDERKRQVLIERRWGGVVPHCTTRVEFQLRRGGLLSFGMGTMEQYLELREGLPGFLCKRWLRFTDAPVDPTHTTRAEMHPVWEKVLRAFREWTAADDERPVAVRNRPVRLKSGALLRQGVGCFVSAVVRSNDAGALFSKKDLYRTCSRLLFGALSKMDTTQAQVDKSLLWHASGPSTLATVTV